MIARLLAHFGHQHFAERPLCAKTGPSSNVAFDPTQTKRVFPDMSSLETKSEIHGYATPA
jgi:hypothetical protein